MNILVFSDSHGNHINMINAVREHLSYSKIDKIFFLGDGYADIATVKEEFPDLDYKIVLGNCDSSFWRDENGERIPYEMTVDVGEIKFMLMHGHKYDVKYSYEEVAQHAISEGADVILFGHTHRSEDTIIRSGGKSVRMINPGHSSGRMFSSYALIQVYGRDVICGFGEF